MIEIEAGNLSTNTLEASVPEVPCGGVKASCQGRERGMEGMQQCVEVKTMSHQVALDPEPTMSGAKP